VLESDGFQGMAEVLDEVEVEVVGAMAISWTCTAASSTATSMRRIPRVGGRRLVISVWSSRVIILL
jgi:hypothetical protein